MATVTNYIGKTFGAFTITGEVGHGAEAEVLACQHDPTGLIYILRLDINEDRLWQGDPLIPPINSHLEKKNIHGTWVMERQQYEFTLKSLKDDPDACKITSPAIYGVLDTRYLVPVSSPIRVKNALNVDHVLRAGPADDILFFEMWEDIVLTMIPGAYDESGPSQEWKDKWKNLVGGSILQCAMEKYLNAGSLSSEQKQRVLTAISGYNTDRPEFAENLLLRLCGCLSRNRISLDEARATLQCLHFRRNVTVHEAQQMIDAASLLQENPLCSENSLSLLALVLNELSNPPLDPFQTPEQFAVQEEEPSIEQFDLFLQEYAGSTQKVLTLTKKK
ncbi:MAG: hypothetical protein GWN67_19225 [Phycisphaerae bacterium]|nr:hypothetical protein [Phycisphaerae bacterium]NIP54321.1 hypothetical protein [Phycisphaerae bacterium]NIS53190.1 hypothetical protein [Phycisphaerae bacterium]NIU10675.1 hypothetical protein [Phycisphaerae bacterium]NIU58436.1 hypothetical protein [Phycisphaerae bacterium]